MIASHWPLAELDGVIERRVLVNFRVDPALLARLLPAPFQPLTVEGFGMAGICLIRLRQVRPSGLRFPGLASENGAHRIAVCWREGLAERTGVFITRRDTNSWVALAAGGRLFPGAHHRADFSVHETPTTVELSVHSDDGATDIELRAEVAPALRADSVFGSLAEASRFYEAGSVGFSPSRSRRGLEGLELQTLDWRVLPLHVSHVRSAFFTPGGPLGGEAEFDDALLMREVPCRWRACRPPAPRNES